MTNGMRHETWQTIAAARQDTFRPTRNVKGVSAMGRRTAMERSGVVRAKPGSVNLLHPNRILRKRMMSTAKPMMKPLMLMLLWPVWTLRKAWTMIAVDLDKA